MKRSLLLATLVAAGCTVAEPPGPARPALNSFRVEVTSLSTVAEDGTLGPLDVVPPCAESYGSQQEVPAEVRGTADCRYVIPRGTVEMELAITALDAQGQPLPAFEGPVSFRVVPGDLSGDYPFRWTNLSQGQGTGKVHAAHLYSETRVWVQDEPPEPIYSDGTVSGEPPDEPSTRTYAAGLSGPVFFDEPTLTAIQQPQTFDNRTSPFVGQFLTIGRTPESGNILLQHCADPTDPHGGQPVTLLVTGTDPSGFFVTDITACRVREDTSSAAGVRTVEPSGYLPGHFGSMFVYNYSFPEGLDTGDLLWTLSGSVQEFTSTSQLTFPSWTIREQVHLLPPDQWNKYLDLNPPVEVNLRHCGMDDKLDTFITDTTCGHNKKNFKMESLESALVKVRHVRFPRVFKNCDYDGNGQVPFFCETTVNGVWTWAGCEFPPPAVDPETSERQCHIDCIDSSGTSKGTLCSERTAFLNFGQFAVEMTSPGPREAGLDDSLPKRWQQVALGATSARLTNSYALGVDVRIWCEADAHVRIGNSFVTATVDDTLLPAHTFLEHTFVPGESSVAFLASGEVVAGSRCHVGQNPHTRINVMTKDAAPELQPDCREDDANAAKAEQCRFLHEATFDVVGHLRHVQPARPRWLIMPRDADDICCYPGPGMSCPQPIKPCTTP